MRAPEPNAPLMQDPASFLEEKPVPETLDAEGIPKTLERTLPHALVRSFGFLQRLGNAGTMFGDQPEHCQACLGCSRVVPP